MLCFCFLLAKNSFSSGTFDVVVVNLYPFYDKVTSTGGIDFEDGIENIDIGGPAMIRAAAKVNFNELVFWCTSCPKCVT